MKQSFFTQLLAANQKLIDLNCGISIDHRGKRLYLRGTFPPKPEAKNQKRRQQVISLGVYANPDGLKFALSEAKKIGALLALNRFEWEPYLRSDVGNDFGTVEAAIAKFQTHYFSTRPDTMTTRQTFKHEYLSVLSKIQKIDIDEMRSVILATEPDTRNRRRAALACAALADFLGLKHDFRALVGKYGVKKLLPRDIPTDAAIATAYSSIDAPEWSWAFALQACYGLRNHEVFYADVSRFPLVQVTEGKTGSRIVYPFFLEWADAWKVFDPKMPDCSGSTNSDLGSRVTHAYKRFEVGFKPYSLRHAWAVRSLRFGLHPTLAAQQMGHDTQTHTKHYQHWIDESVHLNEFNRVMARGDRPMPPPV